jgi:HAT1-interacting factor 1
LPYLSLSLFVCVCVCSVARYGELCPLLAPVYYAYGDALLRLVESKAEALGDAAAAKDAANKEKQQQEEEDEEDDEEEEECGAGAGGAGAGAAEEDITGGANGGDGDDDGGDLAVAFETLEVARVLYKRMAEQASGKGSSSSSSSSSSAAASAAAAGPVDESLLKQSELDLARVHVRLGDCHSEDDKFDAALEEYKTALELRLKHLAADDRRVASLYTDIATCHLQRGSLADGVSEIERKSYFGQALLNYQVGLLKERDN